MNTTEIKKALYKQKPMAKFYKIKSGIATYVAEFKDPINDKLSNAVGFDIPINDMGDTSFDSIMPSQLLIKWLVPHNKD